MYGNQISAGQGVFGSTESDMKHAVYVEMQQRTIGQNINARITSLKAEIARLEGVRRDHP